VLGEKREFSRNFEAWIKKKWLLKLLLIGLGALRVGGGSKSEALDSLTVFMLCLAILQLYT
jgi:hypothetical protein